MKCVQKIQLILRRRSLEDFFPKRCHLSPYQINFEILNLATSKISISAGVQSVDNDSFCPLLRKNCTEETKRFIRAFETLERRINQFF